MAGLTLDAGALIAYERSDARIRDILATAVAAGIVPTVPTVVIAEVWRGDAKDARVARLLNGCNIEPLDRGRAGAAGALRRRAQGAGTVDSCIAVGVLERGDVIATSDPDDMRLLLGAGARLLVV